MDKFTTNSAKETQALGKLLAQELLIEKKTAKKGQVVCLFGDLGSGKTTFTQGLLKGLGAKGPYTSPTFVIMKKYNSIYHIDAYRVEAPDILSLGWKEIVADKDNIVIVEWAERIKKIIPRNFLSIRFKWLDEDRREIKFNCSD